MWIGSAQQAGQGTDVLARAMIYFDMLQAAMAERMAGKTHDLTKKHFKAYGRVVQHRTSDC